MSLQSPLWLLALSVLPLIWWLHRFRVNGTAHPVAALFLWDGDSGSDAPGAPAARAELSWLLRASVLVMLVLALSAPRLQLAQSAALTVWVDDSVSMFTREGGVTRMEQAAKLLSAALSTRDLGTVTLRSLGIPGRVAVLSSKDFDEPLAAFSPVPGGEPQLPAPALMARDREHWLISDGAAPELVAWAARAPLSRRLQVGSVEENAGLSSWSLRRGKAGAAEAAIVVSNGSRDPVRRQLSVWAGERKLLDEPLVLAAGASRVQQLALTLVPGQSLRARLFPTDALAVDDELLFPAAELAPTVVGIRGSCGAHLRAGLASYPPFSVTAEEGAQVDLLVSCDATRPETDGEAVLWVPGGSAPRRLAAAPLWSAAAGELQGLDLQSRWLMVTSEAAESIVEPGTVLLRAGERVLIRRLEAGPLMIVDLDMEAESLVRQPQYPLLVGGLARHLLGAQDRQLELLRLEGPGAAAIAPHDLATADPSAAVSPAAEWRDLTPPLALAALALLLVDLLWLMWQNRPSRWRA